MDRELSRTELHTISISASMAKHAPAWSLIIGIFLGVKQKAHSSFILKAEWAYDVKIVCAEITCKEKHDKFCKIPRSGYGRDSKILEAWCVMKMTHTGRRCIERDGQKS